MTLPTKTIDLIDKSITYSIIEPNECFVLAFESLSKPKDETVTIKDIDPQWSCHYKKHLRDQHNRAKAIMSSLKVTPVIHETNYYPDTLLLFNHLSNEQEKLNEDDRDILTK